MFSLSHAGSGTVKIPHRKNGKLKIVILCTFLEKVHKNRQKMNSLAASTKKESSDGNGEVLTYRIEWHPKLHKATTIG